MIVARRETSQSLQSADEVLAQIKPLAAALAQQDDAGDQVQVIELDATRDEGSTLN